MHSAFSKFTSQKGGDAEEGDGWERPQTGRESASERIPSLSDESAGVGGGGAKDERMKGRRQGKKKNQTARFSHR